MGRSIKTEERMKRVRFIVLSLGLFVSSLAMAGVNQITELRIQKYPQQSRLVLDATKPIHYRQLILRHPDRLVFDIKRAHLVRDFMPSLLENTPIRDIRSRTTKRKLRIVFDLKHKVGVHSFTLLPAKPNGYYRLVIDLQWKKALPSPRKMYFTAYHPPAKRPRKLITPLPAPKRPRNVVVVIDPGHGGKDPGAIGRRRTREKKIVFQIAKRLQRSIDQQPGFTAYLTRKGDYYLTLRQRLAIARRYKADMFVAIHADAYKNRRAHGASVFALSQRGASSEAARWLARQENESELMGGVDLNDKTNLLKSVLINLSQTATIRAGFRIGERIIHSLGNVGRLHHRRVEQAAFVVLKSPDIPSLLVETGFISNPREERKLRNPIYQQRLASAVMQGIRAYFVHRPPRETWLAEQKFNYRLRKEGYMVVRGDTLIGVAERFNVSSSQLRRLNHLKSNRLLIGQALLIPTT